MKICDLIYYLEPEYLFPHMQNLTFGIFFNPIARTPLRWGHRQGLKAEALVATVGKNRHSRLNFCGEISCFLQLKKT